jgi:eukaryotic-like serine/threonine-protein kinase
MASITHPNIVRVTDLGTLEDGRPYFVMDRLEGETLRGLLNRELIVDLEVALELTLELLSALHAVHAAGMVHRDIKPENIFLVARQSCQPMLQLLDFGCCGPMAAREGDEQLTRDWHVVGTAGYMAPEQAAGSRLFHAGIDVFAAALVLLEMLTGFQLPSDAVGVMPSIPAPSSLRHDLPAALDAILGRALATQPRSRSRSPMAFANDLIALRTTLRSRRTPAVDAPAIPSPPKTPAAAPPMNRSTAPMPIRVRSTSSPDYRPTPLAVAAPTIRARAASYVDDVGSSDDATREGFRCAPTLGPAAKDTIRDEDHEDHEDTQHQLRRASIRAIFRS